MKMKRGALIIFEGCDRSGKTTQCQRLVKYLSENLPMIGEGLTAAKMMRFPDRETEIGKTISGYLKQEQHLEDQVVHLLFSANRWERRLDLVKALEAGQHVIVDRYVVPRIFKIIFVKLANFRENILKVQGDFLRSFDRSVGNVGKVLQRHSTTK